MLREDIKKMLLVAINKNELIDYFKGEYPYELESHEFESNILKTNTSEILLKGVYEVFISDEKVEIDKLFYKTLMALLESKDPLNIYIVARYLIDQCRYEKRKVSPFVIDKESIILSFSQTINRERLNLEEYMDSDVCVKIDLYGEVERILSTIRRKYLSKNELVSSQKRVGLI